ncbi:hypothetical protein [Psychrobacter fjordensis]|nr:hypothetical protein [Psychrobacter fjordensis]
MTFRLKTSGSPVVVDVFDNDSAASANLDPTSVIITQSPAGGTIAADGKSVIVAGEGTWKAVPSPSHQKRASLVTQRQSATRSMTILVKPQMRPLLPSIIRKR